MANGLGDFWKQMEKDDQELAKEIAKKKVAIVAEAKKRNAELEAAEAGGKDDERRDVDTR